MACNEESGGEGSSRNCANCLQQASLDRMRHRGAQLRPTSRGATLTAMRVATRGGRMTKRSC
eukprot:365800-Chlamydomonas_euryale.AAC.2